MSKGTCCKKAEPWDIMSGKGDGMIKKRRITRKTRSRHITELPVEERAHYIEERKQRTTEARRQERNTHVMIAVLICLVLASGIFIYETDKWRPLEDTEIPVAAVVEPAPTPTPVPTAWDRIWANASRYPDSFLEALRRNPEIADFVEAYPDTPAEKSGGLRLMEKQQDTPLFLQWDSRWGYVPYGHSNVGISGCGPTCLSMVLFSMTRDETLTPDVLAARAMSDGYYVEDEGTSWLFMRDVCPEYGIKAEQYPYMEEQSMAAELEAGKLIICAMGPGDFTDNGHFILLTAYAGGEFSINDPFSRANSRKKWSYDTLQPQITQIWVYEKENVLGE